MLTLSEPTYQPSAPGPAAVGVLGDDLTVRRIEAVLGRPYRLVAHGATVDALADAERCPIELAVLAGGTELLARGGPVEQLGAVRPSCPIVIVAMTEDVGLIRKALRRGASGLVFHAELEEALAPALAAVSAGQLSVPRAICLRPRWSDFSVRERQVLQLVAEGLTNGQIAYRLYLSESTVKCHLSTGFRKLGVCSRAEAAAAVLDPRTGLMAAATPRAHESAGPFSAAPACS